MLPSGWEDDKHMDTAHDEPGSGRWIPLAAGAVVLVLAGIGFGVYLGRDRGLAPAPTPAPSTATAAASAAATTTDQQPLTTAPTGVTWTIYQTVAFPSSADAGPHHVDDAIATGYSHTATGALIAAANEMLRTPMAFDPQWRAATAAMYADGPGRTVWMQKRSQGSNMAPPAPGQVMQYAGFQFVTYTPSEAVVQLAQYASNPGYTVQTVHLRWEGDDWKIVPAPANGLPVSSSAQVSTLDGFVAWRGV
jgi:hypothetical protein